MYLSLNIAKFNNLPLLSEQNKIFDMARAYLHLPYSVAEYGCGKRADVTTKQLFDLGVGIEAIRYGMIIEPDMSAEALDEKDHTKRKYPLVVQNPFANLMDFNDEILLGKIRNLGATVDPTQKSISLPPYYTGEYTLHTEETVGFNLARSHVFLIIRFYDKQTGNVVRRILDPMLDEFGMFEPAAVRSKLNCQEGVIFVSEIGGYFALAEEYLTPRQWKKLSAILGDRDMAQLEVDARCAVIREFLNNAPKGSIGDPAIWTYDNNLQDKDLTYGEKVTFKDKYERHERRGQQIVQANQKDKAEILKNIAEWSEEILLPLANLVNMIRVHKSENLFHSMFKNGEFSASILEDFELMDKMRGFGVRLRERIERMAEVSRSKHGEIDARTFTPQFQAANIELIQQLNEAGMLVFMDRAGSIHGVLTDRHTHNALAAGAAPIEDITSKALAFHSHIDTVYDAGKYDGRLGVLSGIEIAHVMHDLRQRDPGIEEKLKACPILVSAYVNEEMTYTGGGVSMPGSSAVAGTTEVESIYCMTDPGGNTFKTGLTELLQHLGAAQKNGKIELAHNLDLNPDYLPDPRKFLPRQAIERHCEQADIILKSGVPVAQVNIIMGIHQEDFTIQGPYAEEAALWLITRLRALNHLKDTRFHNTRITNGALHKNGQLRKIKTDFATQYILRGKKDHAGSTAPGDRFDPAVAAGKLSVLFHQVVEEVNHDLCLELEPVVGDFNLYAKYDGEIKILCEGRNAITDTATFSLGVCGNPAPQSAWEEILARLEIDLNENTRINDYSKNKDLFGWHAKPANKVTLFNEVVLTLDVRYEDEETIEAFLEEKERILTVLHERYRVEIASSIEQQLTPQQLDESKNVSLIFDGSIGGSHNPNEAEYPEVVLTGTILQLAATLKFMANPDRKIFDIIKEVLPETWRDKIGYFSSGALHDACQIVVGIEAREKGLNNSQRFFKSTMK